LVESPQLVAAASAFLIPQVANLIHLVAFRLTHRQLVVNSLCALIAISRRRWNHVKLLVANSRAETFKLAIVLLSFGIVNTLHVFRRRVVTFSDVGETVLTTIKSTAVAWSVVSKHVQRMPFTVKHFLFF
jgi:hypothetical protein